MVASKVKKNPQMKRRKKKAAGDRAELKRRAERIAARLSALYPVTKTALLHDNPWQLLVATILSAQCTDAQVNRVTPILFQQFADPQSLAIAPTETVERIIHSTGFFKNKARNIINCSRAIVERFAGKVPQGMDELTSLPGVGRKTANVVRSAWLGIPGMVVDTHVKRLSNLLGLTKQQLPEKIEYELMELLPREQWNAFSMNLILHGRAVCIARRPRCHDCAIRRDCPSSLTGRHG